MQVRYWDRRRYIRIPARGPASWHSENNSGYGELIDVSPGGAALRVPLWQAGRMHGALAIDVQPEGPMRWRLAREARVVRSVPQGDGDCIVGLAFPAQRWCTGVPDCQEETAGGRPGR